MTKTKLGEIVPQHEFLDWDRDRSGLNLIRIQLDEDKYNQEQRQGTGQCVIMIRTPREVSIVGPFATMQIAAEYNAAHITLPRGSVALVAPLISVSKYSKPDGR